MAVDLLHCSLHCCHQAFTTTPGQLLVFRVLSSSGYVHLRVRDGCDFISPAILSAYINKRYQRRTNPSGTVMTTKECMAIEIRSIYNTNEVQFELLSVMPGVCCNKKIIVCLAECYFSTYQLNTSDNSFLFCE